MILYGFRMKLPGIHEFPYLFPKLGLKVWVLIDASKML